MGDWEKGRINQSPLLPVSHFSQSFCIYLVVKLIIIKMSGSNFVDYVKIYCRSGNGGAGSAHFRQGEI